MIATLEEAFAYFANRLRSDAWNAATDAEKEQALTQADALLTACVEWRDGAFTVGSDSAKTFASQVKFALFEEALYLLKVDPTEYPELLTLGVQSASGSTFDRAFGLLDTVEKLNYGRSIIVFQPHTYTRTKALLPDFAAALSAADVVVLADIYAAREKDIYGISSRDLLAKLQEHGTESYYFPSFAEIEKFLSDFCIHGDLLITMGAGNIVTVGEDLLRE